MPIQSCIWGQISSKLSSIIWKLTPEIVPCRRCSSLPNTHISPNRKVQPLNLTACPGTCPQENIQCPCRSANHATCACEAVVWALPQTAQFRSSEHDVQSRATFSIWISAALKRSGVHISGKSATAARTSHMFFCDSQPALMEGGSLPCPESRALRGRSFPNREPKCRERGGRQVEGEKNACFAWQAFTEDQPGSSLPMFDKKKVSWDCQEHKFSNFPL